MAIPFLNHLDLRSVSELQNAILHKTTSATASNVEGKIIYDTGSDTVKYYNGSAWISLSADTGITSITLDSDGNATSGNTITANGTLTLSFDGASTEYVNGEGNLVTFPTIPTVNNGTLTVQGTGVLGGTGTFTANQSGPTTISITHDNTSRTDTTSTGSGNTFTVVDSVTTNATGHVTAINVKTQTVTDDDTTSLPIKNAGGTTQFTSTDVTGLRFEGGTNVTVGFTSADQTVTINSTDQYQGTVTGTGTTNVLPKWTNGGSGVLGDSIITDDGTTVTISGNLDVEGTTTTIDSTTVAIGDNMMKYAKDNTANASDIGWYGVINDGTEKYSGMWYDASTGTSTPKFALGIATTEPAGTGTIAVTGTLVADLEGNADTATTLENSQNFSITGDITANAVSFNGSSAVVLNANIDANVVGATELNVSGNGTNGQVLASDGDGTFSWVNQTANAVDDVTASTANDLLGISISPTTGNVVVGLDIDGLTSFSGAPQADDEVIVLDTSGNTNKKATLSNIAARVIKEYSSFTTITDTATVTHNFGTRNVIVQLYDATTYETVYADVERTTTNAIDVTFASTPTNSVVVLIQRMWG